MLIHKEKLTITPSSGTGTGTTVRFTGVMLHAISIAPATSSTTWKVSIADDGSDVIFDESTTQTGTLARQTFLPLKGKYTITISSASADEAFKVVLWCKDELL